jgi:hypothetical protein
MQYFIVLTDRTGQTHRSTIGYDTLEDGERAFDAQLVTGRFIRAELVEVSTDENGNWVTVNTIASKSA